MPQTDLLKPFLMVTNFLALSSVQFDPIFGCYRRSRNRIVVVLVNVSFIVVLNMLYQWFVMATITRRFELFGVIFGLLCILDSELCFVWCYLGILNSILKSKHILQSCNILFGIWLKLNPKIRSIKYYRALRFMYAAMTLSALYYFVFLIGLQRLTSRWSRTWVRTGIDLMFGILLVLNDIYMITFNTILLLLRAELSNIQLHLRQSTENINNLHELAKLFFEITSLIHLLGKFFMIPIMFNIFATFLKGTIQLFQLFAVTIDSWDNLEFGKLLKEIASYGVWLWPKVLMLCVTMWLTDKISKEANETALCTRHFDDYTMKNTRVTKQINKFLLKNLHQKKKFSAYGFFDIDNSVIYTVFSSIVTYLVILIQFKQLENDMTISDTGSSNTTKT